MKAIIVPPGGEASHMGEGVYSLVSEEGEWLADHFCSSSVFAMGDLYSRRPERLPMFQERGIDGCVWLEESGLTLAELVGRNRAFGGPPGTEL